MSELKPSTYEFTPDLPPPVFEGAPLPMREFQVRTMVNDSLFMRSDSLPKSLGKDENEPIEAVVRELEASDEPIDSKNARLIGLIAAMTEDGLIGSSTLEGWQLAPHIGMLNAISAVLSARLPVSEDALRMAAALHQEYSGRDADVPGDPYASPGADSAVQAIKHTMSNYGSMDFISGEKGASRYLSYYMHDIDRTLYELPVTPEAIASYEEDEEVRHMIDAYVHILAQVLVTREALIGREDELSAHLDQVYERVTRVQADYDARVEARGVQEELPGMETIDDGFISVRQ